MNSFLKNPIAFVTHLGNLCSVNYVVLKLQLLALCCTSKKMWSLWNNLLDCIYSGTYGYSSLGNSYLFMMSFFFFNLNPKLFIMWKGKCWFWGRKVWNMYGCCHRQRGSWLLPALVCISIFLSSLMIVETCILAEFSWVKKPRDSLVGCFCLWNLSSFIHVYRTLYGLSI